jgi:hypothetical protein
MDEDDASSEFHSCMSVDDSPPSLDIVDDDKCEVARIAVVDSLTKTTVQSRSSESGGDDSAKKPSSTTSSNSSWSVLSERERPTVRSITFTRDRTCLIVCTSIGVRIRKLESLHVLMETIDDEKNNNNNTQQSGLVHNVLLPPDGATYAQVLQNTSLLAVIKPSSPRCCYLYNTKNSCTSLAALPLSAAVKRVELQRMIVSGGSDESNVGRRCIVVLVAMTVDLRLHIFHMADYSSDVDSNTLCPMLITTLNIMHPSDTVRNVTRGLGGFNVGSYFDLSPNVDMPPYLICKSFNGTPGSVRVYDPTIVKVLSSNYTSSTASIGSGSARSTASSWDVHDAPIITNKVRRGINYLNTINAHEHSVTRMIIGRSKKDQQTYMATASSKGTTIRVFGLHDGSLLWEWHRGSRSCEIYSISWNDASNRLVTYGSSGTIHVFDWQNDKSPNRITGEDTEDESKYFEGVHNDEGPRAFLNKKTTLTTGDTAPLLKRISTLIMRDTSDSSNAPTSKHRSLSKLKYKPSPSMTHAARSQPLVISFVSSSGNESIADDTDRDDTLVLCSMDCELRRYSVKKSIQQTQIEDVLASSS